MGSARAAAGQLCPERGPGLARAVRGPPSRPILAAAGLFVIIAVVFGSSAAAHLSSGGFIDPGAQSTQAGQVLGQTFRSEDPSFVVLATVRHGNINSPAARKAGHALTVILNDDMGLAAVQSYWAIHNSYWAVGNHHNPVLHSRDGRQALILGYATGDAATQAATTQRIAKQLWSNSVLRVQVGGAAITNLEASNQIKHDLVTAESIALLLTLLLLVLAFRGLIAAPDHRRHRHRRHAAPAARPSFGHQCLRLLAEPHHGPRARARDRLLAAAGVPVPRRTRCRPVNGGRRRGDSAHGGPHRAIQRGHRRGLVAGPAALPGVLPEFVRLCGDRGGGPRGYRRARGGASATRAARPEGQPLLGAAAQARARRRCGPVAPVRAVCHAVPGAD